MIWLTLNWNLFSLISIAKIYLLDTINNIAFLTFIQMIFTSPLLSYCLTVFIFYHLIDANLLFLCQISLLTAWFCWFLTLIQNRLTNYNSYLHQTLLFLLAHHLLQDTNRNPLLLVIRTQSRDFHIYIVLQKNFKLNQHQQINTNVLLLVMIQ